MMQVFAPNQRPSCRAQQGAVAVEMALLMPILLMLLFAAIDFGRAMYEYNTVVKAARYAARKVAAEPQTASQTNAVSAVQQFLSDGQSGVLSSTYNVQAKLEIKPGTPAAANQAARYVSVIVSNYSFRLLLLWPTVWLGGQDRDTITFGPISATMPWGP